MMNAVRVKMCGMTRAEDAQFAAKIGVSAIGLIFYAPSPRAVTASQASTIIEALPPFMTTVGVFVNPTVQYVESILAALSLDILQFHGQETAKECRRYGKPYVKAIHMQANLNWSYIIEEYQDAKGFLLETASVSAPGGTGQKFDWQQIPQQIAKPLILAGGLTTQNIASAIQLVHPYAVDVTTGVEAAKGIKDPAKMQNFMREVVNAQRKERQQ